MSKPGFFKSPEMAKKFPLNPKHPERTCWGCDKYCSVDALQCGARVLEHFLKHC